MKKNFGYLSVVFVIVGLLGLTGSNALGPGMCLADEIGPVLTTGTPLVKMGKKAEVVIMGTGFKPGQALNILFSAADGTTSNIGHDLKPEPKADNTGSFGGTWAAGRYVSKGLIKGGPYKIVATDTDYNPIAQSAVFFQKEKEEKKK